MRNLLQISTKYNFSYIHGYIIITSLFFSLISLNASGQTIQIEDSTRTYIVRTLDKNEFTGVIIFKDLSVITLETKDYGNINIKLSNIKSIDEVKPNEIVNGQVWPNNPQSSRYFWAPSGYGIEKGEVYYQNIWVLFNQFSYGVTDYFSISAGIVPLFLFAGTSTPVWVVPKFSIPAIKDKLNFGAGVLAGTILGESESGFGILFGDVTVGGRNRNATLTVGYGYAEGESSNGITINLSGFTRITKNVYLITENYLIYSEGQSIGAVSFGGRSIINRIGVDYALVLPYGTGLDINFVLPLLGITLPLSK
ncbi:MAG: hypothetical protein IPG60_08500 [Bacteroidetes bacterium]|nr:hypothetical protein [Bacteroidota bacterium]MBP7400592.1 hypothetical protein [Chitinophagales bacterium]MBP8753232.1 hypothetical protein [Chitinophagales bacterium]MBP9188868.1 hypothetical protein [Chitinophagales bacterium]MBP9548788.1 hypothetical protein [Chitinophagales bacterium]